MQTTQIHADHTTAKRLGDWTRSNLFQVRARKGMVVLDLRSTEIAGDIDLTLDLQRSALTLLLPQDVAVDQWDLRFPARGRVHDLVPAEAGRTVRLAGTATDSQIRVRRGARAELTAMFSPGRLKEMHRAHQIENGARA